MNSISRTALSIFVAYSTHYFVTKMYSTFCIPDGLSGFLSGSMTTGSPICSTTFGIMTHTHVTYSTLILTSLSRLLIDGLANIQPCSRKIEHKEELDVD